MKYITCCVAVILALCTLTTTPAASAEGLARTGKADTASDRITSYGFPAQLEIRKATDHSLRITLTPDFYEQSLPPSPMLAPRSYPEPALRIKRLDGPVSRQIGNLYVEVRPDPLTLEVQDAEGNLIQSLRFPRNGTMQFQLDDAPVLGLGEGGPERDSVPPLHKRTAKSLEKETIEFDRRGRLHEMIPRWQRGLYGSRNPVPMMIGTSGWGLFVPTPWGRIDLREEDRGTYIPIPRTFIDSKPQTRENQYSDLGKGLPPLDQMVPGVYDVFVFDAGEPLTFMEELTEITGNVPMPPKWTMGYMQSHRNLESDSQMVQIAKTFREKEIPLDAVIYLGTGFAKQGWNTPQPSFEYAPEVFERDPETVIEELHRQNVNVGLHLVPWGRDKMPTLHGDIPPGEGETVDSTHILHYWRQHLPLVEDGVDGFWADEGDYYNLNERMKRHEVYHDGPLHTHPNERPWSLHRNGYLGIARWGGWMWSGDTESSWKTLKAQIAAGINHSLSLSPFWGSDIGGFYPTSALDGELYARWFQFGAFNPLFRAHGKTWMTRLPWGWGREEPGPLETPIPPDTSALGDPRIEPIAKKYAELRYRLLPYNYSITWQARTKGIPLMRSMWLHHPDDPQAARQGDQYFWGRDLLIAPVYTEGAESHEVYLPDGTWYDWWTGEPREGGRTIKRPVELSVMPIYARSGSIIPLDPVRSHVYEDVDQPTQLRIYPGEDGNFSLYDDDGKTMEYQDGAYQLIRLEWDDRKRTLTLTPQNGNPAEKRFHIEVVGTEQEKTVRYTGERMTVDMRD